MQGYNKEKKGQGTAVLNLKKEQKKSLITDALSPSLRLPRILIEDLSMFFIQKLARIQGYHYHLSKFHIYALVYCVFLSGLLLTSN